MNFSAWSIRNPIAPILLFIILMVLGWQSFNSLPITRFPNIDIPLVSIQVGQVGGSPSEIESQITKKIEDAVSGVTGVKNVTSKVTNGNSLTLVEFQIEVPTEKAVQDTKDAIDGVISDLPASAETPVVSRIDVEGQAIMTYAVNIADMTIAELSWFVDDVIISELQGLSGVGSASRYGGVDREVRVELNPIKLDSYGITASAVSRQLDAINVNVGAGRAKLGSGEQTLRAIGDVKSVDKLASTRIALPNGRYVKLSDLGSVVDSYEDIRSVVRSDGDRVVSVSVYRANGASEVTAAENVTKAVEKLREKYPSLKITLVDETVFYVYGNYKAAIDTLIEGAVLAIAVVWLFLRNWRATLISAVALPLSIIPTFFVLELLGFSLNLVSFLALTLATGILVDDAIVEIENIARHIRMGKTPYRAAVEAADEIGLAVIATTLTIIAIFVPVSFMPGVLGQYFSQFGMTVAVSVFFSLMVARLITPMMAAYLMRSKDASAHEEVSDGFFMVSYLKFVRKSLKRRYLTLIAAIMILLVSVYYMSQIPGSFLPAEDVSRISLSVELPPGSGLDETDKTTQEMTEIAKDIVGVRDVFILNGASPTGTRDTRRASFIVLLERLDHSLLRRSAEVLSRIPVIGNLVPVPENKGRTRRQREIETELFAKLKAIPDIRLYKLNDRGARDLSFSILSSNDEDLSKAVSELETALSNEPLLANVASEGSLPRPEIRITPKKEIIARLGITTNQIADSIRVATIGDFDSALTKVSLDGRLIPVRVLMNENLRKDISRLGALKVNTSSGKLVPLSSVADITVSQGPAEINRLNRARISTIGANLPDGVTLSEATERFNEIVSSVKLPPSVRVADSGDAEIQNEMQESFVDAMILGLILVLTVLILLFKSVLQPFTILFSLPLALGGVAAALILTNSAVSMPVLIGFFMLMGIVTKNAILLIDFAIDMRRQGMDRFNAVIEAGHKRARPIIMTSIAMAAGMLPSAMGVGEGGAFRAPMATAVIGGIIVSTALSLIVVPAFYLVVDDLSTLIFKHASKLVGQKEEEILAPDNVELAEQIRHLKAEQKLLSSRIKSQGKNSKKPKASPST